MKLVIDIPEDLYKATINGLDDNELWDLRVAIKDGIVVAETDILIHCRNEQEQEKVFQLLQDVRRMM